MTYSGRVHNGVIVLNDGQIQLAEGEEVRVEVVNPRQETRSQEEGALNGSRSLADRLQNSIGKAEGLPADSASRIDDYLYGDAIE